MAARSLRFLTLCCPGILSLVAAVGWLGFMGNGLAYGDLVGIPGPEQALAELGGCAERALALVATCEAIAIGIGSSVLMPLRNPRWARIWIAIVLTAIADLFTLVAIKGV